MADEDYDKEKCVIQEDVALAGGQPNSDMVENINNGHSPPAGLDILREKSCNEKSSDDLSFLSEVTRGDQMETSSQLQRNERILTHCDVSSKFSERLDYTSTTASSKFNCAHFINFRNKLFEAVEELRLRRVAESENEEKIKALVKQKHQLECKHKEDLINKQVEIDAHVDKMSSVKQNCEMSVKQLQEEKNKLAMAAECGEKEARALQEETLELQMNVHTLEQKVRDQDRKLHLQSSTQDSHLTRLAELEDACRELTQKSEKLACQEEYLHTEVKEAIAVNEKLTSVNQHQTCLLNAYKNELTKVKQELVSVKIRLDCEPQDTAKQHGESEHHIKTLQAQLKVREEALEGLRKDMVCSSEQNEKCTNALRDAHCLIQRHQDRNCEITKGAEITRQEMKAQQNKLDQLKQDYDEQARQMEINTQSYLVAVQDWQKQEAEISSRLEILQQEVSRLTTTCTELEQLNSTWANQNVALTTQITDLKKKYENEKADMESQASVTVETQDTQTEEGVDWESEASALQQQLDSANRERQLLDSELQEMKRRLDQVKKNKVSMASQTEILQKSTGTLCQLPEECTSSNSSEVKLASSITCKENSSHSNIITSSKSTGSFVPSTTACCTPLHGLSVSCSSASAQSILSSESERNSTLPVSVCSEESWERNGQNISSHSAKSVDFHVAERFKSPGMEMQCQNQTSCSCSSVEANHQSSCPANSEKDDTNETGPARGLGSVNSLESPPLHLKTTTESLKLESCGSAEYENMEKYADSRVQWNDNGKCDLIEMSEDKQKSSFGKPLELLHDKQSARGDEVIAPPPSKRLCMQFNPSPVPMTTDEVKGQLDSSGAKQWLVKCEDEQNQNESESLHHDEAKHRFTNILHDQNQIAEKPMTSLLKMPQGQSSTKQKKKVTFSDESCKENVQIDKEDKRMIAMNVTKEAVNAAISGEESLFSDDEDTSPFEIQSRVARIESYLRADRLRVLKKDDKT